MSYAYTQSQLTAVLAGASVEGFITLAKFKKMTTPSAVRIFRKYIRPRCPFRHYLHLRHTPCFDKYLKHHRRKRHPVLTKPLLNLAWLKHLLKNMGQNPPCAQTLKMQNKAKLKTAHIPITPFILSTNKKVLRSPQTKNKAKQTQTKVAQASSLSVTPTSSRQFVIPAQEGRLSI